MLAILVLCASEAAAQQLSLSGTVRDTTGVVPGVTVILARSGAAEQTTMTDQLGAYSFSGLPAGSVELTFSLRGFETVIRNISLGADTPAVDVLLAVGRVTTAVTVQATAGKATATRLPVPDSDVPAQVSTIPSELMRQQGVNSIGEALRNASGVQSIRWYGVYEQYTIRGSFDDDRDGFNVVLLDGMRRGGNRYATQSNNIDAVEVLKGPSSILYGRGAVGGTINIVRKKPQAVRSSEVLYRGGRFNTHQVALGNTGPVGDNNHLLYRVDTSFEASDGWRNAGADRFNVAPSLTWLVNDKSRLTLHQVFVRDRFDGDGGVPLNIIDLPDFKRDARFSLPQDRVLLEDSQTQALFNAGFGKWEFRNSVSLQRTSDKYFVTEGVYGSPEENLVYREPLDFHHIRRPIQNQSEVVGRFQGFGTHNLLAGYEYYRDKYRTEVTAGDDPDCICGYWWLTIKPMDISTMREEQTPLDIDTVARTTFVNDQTHSFYVQDQIDVAPKVKVNLGYRNRRLLAGRRPCRRSAVHAAADRPDARLLPGRSGLRAALRSAGIRGHVLVLHAGHDRARGRHEAGSEHGPQLRVRPSLAGTERPRGHDGRGLLHHPRQRHRAGIGDLVHPGRRAAIEGPRLRPQHRPGPPDVADLQLWVRGAEVHRRPRTERQDPAFRAQAHRQPVVAQGLPRRPERRLRFPLPRRSVHRQREHPDARQLRHRRRRRRLSHAAVGLDGEHRQPVRQPGLLSARPLQQQRIPGPADQRHDDVSAEVELAGRG
jgi:hypothetical protein